MKRLVFAVIAASFPNAGFIQQVFAQSTELPPAFTLADVHASDPATKLPPGASLVGGRVDVHRLSMLELIMLAYEVEPDYVIGGPGWLNTDRFDILAKAAPTTPQDALRPMLQALLAERFSLAIRKEERPMPVYALTVGKRGSKLKESANDSAPNCNMTGSATALATLTCQHMTVKVLVQQIRGLGILDRPIVDLTSLTGNFDYSLSYTPPNQVRKATHADSDQPRVVSIFEAVDKQLGLKLEQQTSPLPVIVVAHVNEKPTENAPGVAHTLAAVPTEFEVAEIRVSKPGATEGPTRFLQSGRLELPGATLKRLLTLAYGVEPDMIANAPKWWDSDRFDLVAKTNGQPSPDTLRAMLQKLLAERFNLKVHNEDQPVDVFAMTLGKRGLKLRDATESERSECRLSVADGLGTYACQNTTMAQFAEKIHQVAGGYLNHPVVDLTGLKGAYDFALTWAPANRFAAGGRGVDPNQPGSVASAADPTGDITVFEAVDKFLGLKLAEQKYPMSVIVIDHLDRTPTEN
jgi:uncharacterized protein (TIGR03435 family)